VPLTDIESRAVVQRFLESYLRCTPTSMDKNFADALNMMTQNLRIYSLNQLRDQDLIGKIKDPPNAGQTHEPVEVCNLGRVIEVGQWGGGIQRVMMDKDPEGGKWCTTSGNRFGAPLHGDILGSMGRPGT
jgi:hypothetical protein